MALSMVGPSTTALMIAQGKFYSVPRSLVAKICFKGIEFGTRGGTITSDPEISYWNFIWPKLITFGPIIFYVILCWWAWARDYQLKVAGWISLLYSFLMIYVFVALIVQGPAENYVNTMVTSTFFLPNFFSKRNLAVTNKMLSRNRF